MPVPRQIEAAYAGYLAGMDEARRRSRSFDGLFGIGGSKDKERCQDEFVAALGAAVDELLDSAPDRQTAFETVEFIFSQSRSHRDTESAYWMLLASHIMALPLIELLGPDQAAAIRERYEADIPKRERFPAQKKVIAALKARERAK